MEDKFFPLQQLRQKPATALVLESTSLEVSQTPDKRMVILEFIPDGLGFRISVPWDANDFRMMVSGWLAKLQEADTNNGFPTAES